jgi:glycosyltransferase involved in cell wall biosynthesis
MRILHVVAGLQPAGAGLSEVVPRFALEAKRLGHEVSIATVASGTGLLSNAAVQALEEGVRILRFAPSFPQAIYFSTAMLRGLPAIASAADVVHVHSNWTFPVWWASHCARRADRPLVMSPHGCLDPVRLAHSFWKKRLVGPFDHRCLRQAAMIHATSELERSWIHGYLAYHSHQSDPVVVIPCGVDLPASRPAALPRSRHRQVLYLGRLHPLKGLDALLPAWAIATSKLVSGDSWRLVIAGPGERSIVNGLKRQATELGVKNMFFPGPLYGADKAEVVAGADLLVLPSRSENFGMVVAEALAAGVPVIATKGTPWGEIEGKCGWHAEATIEGLAHALIEAMRASDEDRAAMGERGRELVRTRYRWTTVGRSLVDAYSRLVAAPSSA